MTCPERSRRVRIFGRRREALSIKTRLSLTGSYRHERPLCSQQEAVIGNSTDHLRRVVALVLESALGSPNHIRSIQALRTLLAFELNCFTLVQRLVSGVLDGGEMYEHIFSGRTLDEPIAFCAVKPLHNPVFLHIHSFGELPLFAFGSVP